MDDPAERPRRGLPAPYPRHVPRPAEPTTRPRTGVLRSVLTVLRRHVVMLLAGGLLGLSAAAGLTALVTPQYESVAQVMLRGASWDPTWAARGQLLANGSLPTLLRVTQSNAVATRVLERTGVEVEPAALRKRIRPLLVARSGLLTLVVDLEISDADPEVARQLAQGYADEFVEMVAQVQPRARGGRPLVEADVVQPAVAATDPVSPSWPRNLVLGLLFGLAAAFSVALLRELADVRLRTPQVLAETSRLPVLGALVDDPQAAAADPTGAPSPGWEEGLRTLRTHLGHAATVPPQVVLTTGPGGGEGATTVASHLAVALARVGQRVLLVDVDPVGRGLSRRLDLHEAPHGLFTVLRDGGFGDALQRVGPVDVLPTGPVPAGGSDLLGSDRVAALVADARRGYDVVLLDGAPALSGSGAQLFGRVDLALLVLDPHRTTSGELRRSQARLEAAGVATQLVISRAGRDTTTLSAWQAPLST